MFIIAEAGTAHQGLLENGFKLIEKAAEAGADCIKFQIVYADEIIHHKTGKVSLPGGNISLYETFKSLEKDEDFFYKLKQEAQKCGLIFLASAFGIKSAKLLKDLGVSIIKIASPEINHFPLLKEVSSYGIPLILSGGVSTLSDIEKAVKITGKDITFLHAITSYPAPPEEYNLKLLNTLSGIFGFKTGVSDHSTDPLLVPLTSAALGAVMLEKHFTLNNTGGGLDDLIALNPENFKKMTSEIREFEKDKSAASSDKIKYLQERFGKKLIDKIMGDGIKVLAKSEEANYKTTNRSLIALRFIKKGEIVTEKDFAPLRSEKNILPGLSPEFADIIIGKKAIKNIEDSCGINFEHFFET